MHRWFTSVVVSEIYSESMGQNNKRFAHAGEGGGRWSPLSRLPRPFRAPVMGASDGLTGDVGGCGGAKAPPYRRPNDNPPQCADHFEARGK